MKKGIVVEQDYDEAIKWYEKAAEQVDQDTRGSYPALWRLHELQTEE